MIIHPLVCIVASLKLQSRFCVDENLNIAFIVIHSIIIISSIKMCVFDEY